METKGDYKKQKGRKICVKCYFNPDSFQAVAADAERAGKRRGGLLLFTQKPHGFQNEQVSNTGRHQQIPQAHLAVLARA